MSSFFDITASNKPVLIDFFAEWCAPCKMMSPILIEVKEILGDQIKLLKVDVDKNQRLAKALNVKGVPTLVLYKKVSCYGGNPELLLKMISYQKYMNIFKHKFNF